MKEETLIILTTKISRTIEEILPLGLTDTEIYRLLEERVGYCLAHIRDVFGTTTGIGLNKYITRRNYTYIVEKLGKEVFYNLKQKESVHNIQKFKTKCIKEFPFLTYNFDTNKMQQPLEEEYISILIQEQLKIKSINAMMDSLFGDITKGRKFIDLTNRAEKILIQDENKILIDLQKCTFKKDNIIFMINATENIESQHKDEFLSLIFNTDIYISNTYPIDVNIAIKELSNFFTKRSVLKRRISISTTWGGDRWGSWNLIESTEGNNDEILKVKLVKNTFLEFDKEKVWLDTNFYTKRH